MDQRSRCRSYNPRCLASPEWQPRRRDRAHTVCLIVDNTRNDFVRYRRSSSPGEHSLGAINLYSSGSDGQDSVFDFSSSTTTTTTSGPSSRSPGADSPPFISLLRIATSSTSLSRSVARISPPRYPATRCYRPLHVTSLPRYSELSSTYPEGGTGDRVGARTTPPPPYRSCVSRTVELPRQATPPRRISKTSLMIFLLAAAFQTLTGAVTAALALASLGFMPDSSMADPTFFSSGFTVFVTGLHGMIGFCSLKNRQRPMKFCIAADALFSLGCLILSVVSAMESQETTDHISETYQCVQQRTTSACICFPPSRPDLVLVTHSNSDRSCSVSDAVLLSLIHANILGNLCSCVPSSVVIIVFFQVVMKESIRCRRREREAIATLRVTRSRMGTARDTDADSDSDSAPPSYETACRGRRCFSPNQPHLPFHDAVFELAVIPEAPPSYSTDRRDGSTNETSFD